MTTKSERNIKLGLFVILAVALLAAVIILLAGRRWGATEYPAYTTLNESVQGLEVGSPVKFRGVPIGSVRKIIIQDEDLDVRVDMELYEGSIQIKDMTIREFLQKQIRNGARCRLEITGITGFRYIEIEMIPPKKLAGKPGTGKTTPPRGPLYIPSVRSVMAGVTANLSYTLAEIADIDFNSIGTNIDQLLNKLNAYMQDERIGKVIDHLTETSQQLAELSRQLNEGGIAQTMDKIKATLENLNQLVSDVHGEVKKAELAELAQEVDNAVREISKAASKVNRFSDAAEQALTESEVPQTMAEARRSIANIESTLNRTTTSLDKTLKTLGRFAELLEKDTGALLRGKRTPPAEIGRE